VDEKELSQSPTKPKMNGARQLAPPAERALAEAAVRRAAKASESAPATEIAGRDGPEPIRYGDWEVKGIASDF
jgi:hypothetical protein